MKKIYLYVALFASLITSLASCGDNEDFWSTHNLTQDEMNEIARQDSIANAQKNNINANLILEYTADITLSTTLYDGPSVVIEMNKIAEAFGITEEELLAGIDGESGAPEVKGFAIEGTTHADNASASNTNAPWGHWWDKDGNVTTWGTDAMVFAEFDTETKAFTVGQYPAHLADGQSFKIIEGLKYNDIRVAVVITVNAMAAGQITATIAGTQELSLSVTPRSDYTQDPLQFDLSKTLSDLGVASMDEVKFIGVNADGSYAQEAVTTNGFWYDKEGFVGAWGDDASVYTSYGDEDAGFETNYIGIGQMPDNLSAGESYTIQYGFLANNKIEMLKITVTVTAYEDPETPPEGEPTTVEKDITFEKPYDNTYANEQVDVAETLREAFKMTTYQIFSAKQSGDLKVYLNAETDSINYTADVPGYWIAADGVPTAYADGIIWCSLGGNETSLYLYGGNHPDNCSPNGQTIETKMIITCNGGKAIFNITYKVTAQAAE